MSHPDHRDVCDEDATIQKRAQLQYEHGDLESANACDCGHFTRGEDTRLQKRGDNYEDGDPKKSHTFHFPRATKTWLFKSDDKSYQDGYLGASSL